MSKVALVTGGTRGIGAAIAKALVAREYNVVVTYHKDDESADSFAKSDPTGRLHIRRSDICLDQDIFDLVEFIGDKLGHLDVLVNNAGKVIAPPDWRHITRRAFIETLDTNLVGPAVLARHALPLLEKGQSSTIINIGSTYGIMGDPWVIAYSAAKAGIIQLTRALAKELAPRLRVNAILPGHIDTRMTNTASPEFLAQVINGTPLHRLGTTQEVADLAVFLTSDSAQFITGQTIIIDGGHILR